MPTPWDIATISLLGTGRGAKKDTEFTPREFRAQSVTITSAWGAQAATATIEYAGTVGDVIEGQFMDVSACGQTLHGFCKSVLPKVSSGGQTCTLEFCDFREFMADWDDVVGCFNKEETVWVGSERIRRYYSIFPNNAISGQRTYGLLTAAQIIDAILTAVTTENHWSVYHCDSITGEKKAGYHPSLKLFPAYDVDCTGGKKVGAAIQEVLDQHGMLYTIIGGAFDLVFGRKGEGRVPNPPVESNDRLSGKALSKAPTRIRVLGGNNHYQLLNIAMVPDWAAGYQQFFDVIKFQDYIFNNWSSQAEIRGITTGTPYNAIPNDTEGLIGRQLATARSLEITLRQFALYRNRPGGEGDGALFVDYRRFNGKFRMEMPVALYIRNVLFRCFRLPQDFWFENSYGRRVNIGMCEIVPRQILATSYEPKTGVMNYDTSIPSDGPGLAIVQGYQVGLDGFKAIRPERFNLNEWTDLQNIWQAVPFSVDDSGAADGQFIIFDEPVIRSADLFTKGSNPTEVAEFNGYAGMSSFPTFVFPPVLASLTFRAERFSWYVGNGGKDDTLNIPELACEFVGDGNGWASIPYADGFTAQQKAIQLGASKLAVQFTYQMGGYKRVLVPTLSEDGNKVTWPTPTALNGMIDRVTIRSSPGGFTEEVDYTNERSWRGFEPTRDYERRQQDRALFPGQKESMAAIRTARQQAAAFRDAPQVAKTMYEALHGDNIGMLLLEPSTGRPFAAPVWKPASVTDTAGRRINQTCSAAPTDLSYDVYMGSLACHGGTGGTTPVYQSGIQPVRVLGPVNVHDSVGKSNAPGVDYMVSNGDPGVGKAMEKIEVAEVRVIQVRLGVGGDGATLGLRGQWNPVITYLRNDFVYCDDIVELDDGTKAGMYKAKTEIPGNGTNKHPSVDTANWELYARGHFPKFSMRVSNKRITLDCGRDQDAFGRPTKPSLSMWMENDPDQGSVNLRLSDILVGAGHKDISIQETAAKDVESGQCWKCLLVRSDFYL